MSDEIKNAGTKGYILLFFIIMFFAVIGLMLYIYYYNFNFLPG